ncbi:hypothetical protein ABFA25_10710 [Mycobacterium lepromatosis]
MLRRGESLHFYTYRWRDGRVVAEMSTRPLVVRVRASDARADETVPGGT